MGMIAENGIITGLQQPALRAKITAEKQQISSRQENKMPVSHTINNDTQVNSISLKDKNNYGNFLPFLGKSLTLNATQNATRLVSSPNTAIPISHVLTGGRDNNFRSIITAAGSGGIQWNNIALTRHIIDPTSDKLGNFIFLKDKETNKFWSAGYQPVGGSPDSYQAKFSEEKAVISRKDGDISSELQVIVSPEDNAEMRRVSITNNSNKPKEIEVTSYSELVLTNDAADASHPAFSKLFVQTEYDPKTRAIIAKRRPRGSNDKQYWAAHTVAVNKKDLSEPTIQYETNRTNFIGRDREISNPVALSKTLSNEKGVGIVLDPVASLRPTIKVQPGETVNVDFSFLAGQSKDELLELVNKYNKPSIFNEVANKAKENAIKNLKKTGISAEKALIYQQVTNKLLYSDPAVRPEPAKLVKLLTETKLSYPQGLWGHGISGDLPIIVVNTTNGENKNLLKETLSAAAYSRSKGFPADVVILDDGKTIDNEIKNQIDKLNNSDKGKAFIVAKNSINADSIKLFKGVAALTLESNNGSLKYQIGALKPEKTEKFDNTAIQPSATMTYKPASLEKMPPLEFFNGLGGFTKDGHEYVIRLDKNNTTPAPWVNVIANEKLGFIASESGGGYTWAGNSRENKLTPWSNDPVTDKPGEIFYIKDKKTGSLWSPTANPVRVENSEYVIKHGHGYSKFSNNANGIKSELLQFATKEDPVKLTQLKLENQTKDNRELSVTNYIEWVLGVNRQSTAKNLIIEREPETGALLVRNPLSNHFGEKVAFLDFGDKTANRDLYTGDRSEFLGPNGSLDNPAALRDNTPLQKSTGAGLDLCAAMQSSVMLKPGEKIALKAIMGQANSKEEAIQLIKKYRHANINNEMKAVTDNWENILGKVKVKTPDESMNKILNRWLVYQNLSCRLLGKSAFYQSGGAFGFRDQLQDIMTFCQLKPELAKKQILRAAAHQFKEGDVLHWWHQYPKEKIDKDTTVQCQHALPELEEIQSIGIRTDFKDDRVWLPYVTAFYVAVTGDKDILNMKVPFVEGPPLGADREDVYTEVTRSNETATLYDHCARALNISMESGPHGLPTMGAGDWNDGMNRVGHKGTGESVWLGWFLAKAMTDFVQIAKERGEENDAQKWQNHVKSLSIALDNTWDGEKGKTEGWFKRAYYDDGTPLGSKESDECKIDILPQSWSVISGIGDPEKAKQAMESVKKHLVDDEHRIVKLFTPPFDQTKHDPGYIKGYLPGIRENGGQYTHGTIWSIDAFAKLGDGNMAHKIFNLLNPVNHGRNPEEVNTYKVEPYVVAADVYGASPLEGRGGWTWYTGSAGWLHRVGMESILGINVRNENTIEINPCIPENWPGYEVDYKYGNTNYTINVINPDGLSTGVKKVIVDGKESVDKKIHMVNDGTPHNVRVIMGQN
jgi:cyclic beta-1,2-glucan synthetase